MKTITSPTTEPEYTNIFGVWRKFEYIVVKTPVIRFNGQTDRRSSLFRSVETLFTERWGLGGNI